MNVTAKSHESACLGHLDAAKLTVVLDRRLLDRETMDYLVSCVLPDPSAAPVVLHRRVEMLMKFWFSHRP